MSDERDLVDELQAVNQRAAFNRWAGFRVESASAGEVSMRMPWRDELGQYAGHLHAGLISAMIDTTCGFAGYTISGQVVASHCAVSYLAPGIGSAFVATARVVKAGRRQLFLAAELHAEADGARKLIATGQTLLIPTG
jgi:uncharacterized protein (TIGR00369 family)